MGISFASNDLGPGGISIEGTISGNAETAVQDFLNRLEELDLVRHVEASADAKRRAVRFRLRRERASEWMPDWDTTRLCLLLGLDTQGKPDDLEREILLAMLAGPIPFTFPSCDELAAAVRIRGHIVEAARKTELSFHTTEAERPAEYWAYAEGRGFTLLPGKSLVEALRKATQPEESGTRYGFSCYRATEYVILLGIAQELETCNPELLSRLQRCWESRAIMSGEFHEVFLHEHGAMEAPLPLRYYVPGDRVWFRNPDRHSSDATGYEGSWVMYLGGGLFSNFWNRRQPYTLAAKCIEIFHWRNATWRDEAGELRIDESLVERHVRASNADPAEVARILGTMLRHREPRGVYLHGGCVDTTREHARRVCPGTSDIALPAA